MYGEEQNTTCDLVISNLKSFHCTFADVASSLQVMAHEWQKISHRDVKHGNMGHVFGVVYFKNTLYARAPLKTKRFSLKVDIVVFVIVFLSIQEFIRNVQEV